VRSLAHVDDDFANAGWNFDEFESGGGKGGCLMAFLGSEYIVKELSLSDHQSLLEIAADYLEHIRGGSTLLCAILLHFQDQATGRLFFAMRNAIGSGPYLALYDLKGCNDDKTLEVLGEKIRKSKSIWASGWTCGSDVAASLGRYNAGKKAASRANIMVTAEQRAEISARMQRDTQWLAKNELMDYSLLVGVKSGPKGFMDASSPNTLGQATFVWDCKDGSQVAVSVAIIDCLQQWTLVKKAAQAIKCMEFNRATVPPKPYAQRFSKHLSQRFVDVDVKPRIWRSSTDSILFQKVAEESPGTLRRCATAEAVFS
jgi:hypothetical protein